MICWVLLQKGHYFVLQASTPEVAKQWVAALQREMASTLKFAVPIMSKTPSLYRDIILVDLGSSNIRAGVLTHQGWVPSSKNLKSSSVSSIGYISISATLPALFFASVMSENLSSGKRVYGNDVYKPENRQNAKITFPFECTSRMCQVN